MSRRRKANISKTLKDYAVAIIGFLLILILLYSVFLGYDKEKLDSNTDSVLYHTKDSQVSLSSSGSIAYIVYDSGKKVKIEDTTFLGKLEKVVVESGNVFIDFPGVAQMKLSENGEFSYTQDGSFHLDSGDLWIEALINTDVSMKYANVSLSLGSVSNLNQNEIESTIYSISGNINVGNLAGVSTNVANSEKLVIKNTSSTSLDIDINSLKSPIDDYFRLSSWFKFNGGDSLLKKSQYNSSDSGSNVLNLQDSSSLINFADLVDESYVDSKVVDLKGRYSPIKVGKITIGGREVSLDRDLGIFGLNGVSLPNKTNDFIIKIYDNDDNVISKKVFTLYSEDPSASSSQYISIDNVSSSSSNSTISTNTNGLLNYSVKPTDFSIYAPSTTGKFTTTNSRVTIRGRVSNKDVSSVSVNGYTLKSYNGSTWRYHAFIEQETLKEGSNNYEIKYFNKDGNVIYTEYYSIFKQKFQSFSDSSSQSSLEKFKDTGIISGEAIIN